MSDSTIVNIAIVSRDYQKYRELFQLTPSKNTRLIYAASTPDSESLKDAQIILSEPDIAVTYIDQCKKLTWLQSTWAGNNRLQEHSKRDYLLTGVKGIFAQRMREYVFAYLLHFSRNIEQMNRLQQLNSWVQPQINDLAGKTLGILGLGSIGVELAKAASAFEINVIGLSTQEGQRHGITCYASSQITELAKQCDFIVNLLPETAQTKALCDQQFFNALPNHAIFINAGRGSVVEPETLITALSEGQLKAAVLDVFVDEPLNPEHPYYRCENLYITNHTAAISDPERVFSVFSTNIQRYLAKQHLLFVHDFDRGY